MSSWNIGIDDVSEETQALKNRLSSKDGHIAAQETQLMKQAAELDEIKSALNDALHKLSSETDHALRLETDLKQCSEDLRNEKITSQNVETALAAAREKIKSKDLEARDLQSTIESLSYKSDGFSTRSAKLEHEKGTLEARVRELQANLRELSSPPVTPGRYRTPRPRSSSLSNFRITTLEQELNDVRASLSEKEADLRTATQQLAHVQGELMRIDNEKLSMEKRLKTQLGELQASLEDKDEELEYLRAQQGDGGREEELLQRIEEDDAKIVALEMLLGDSREMQMMKETLKRTEERLQMEAEKASESERRQIELVRDREEALDELEDASAHIAKLEELANEREARIDAMNVKERHLTSLVTAFKTTNTAAQSESARAQAETRVLQVESGPNKNAGDDGLHDGDPEALYSRQPTPGSQALPEEAGVTYVGRLLAAIERLRGERDNLRRDVQFLESESKFTVEALEEKLAALASPALADDHRPDVAADQLSADTDVLRWPLEGDEAEAQIGRLGLTATVSAVVIGHLRSQADVFAARFREISTRLVEREQELRGVEEKFQALEVNLEVTLQCLAEATSQVSQLESKDAEWVEEVERVKIAHEETQDNLERAEAQLADVSKSLEEVESERDSLTLQVTNLMTDVYSAQQELTEAESRYSTLQFHQLSTMSSNEATRALRDQIEELEMRVMRRTEQIGAHQQDIKRLETNLRLQEERLEEMTVELEMMAAEKEAMVEDCATAREARDEAIVRLEGLELDVEGLEGRVEEKEEVIVALVSVVMQTVSRSRDAVRLSSQRARRVEDELYHLGTEHRTTMQLLEQKTSTSVEQRRSSETSGDAVRWTALAVPVSQVELNKSLMTPQVLNEARTGLEGKVKTLQERLEAELVETKSLAEQLETLRCKPAESEDLEEKLLDVQQVFSAADASHRGSVMELLRAREQLRERLDEKESLLARNNMERELDQLVARHAEELGELQARLDQTLTALEEARSRCATSEASHQETLAESARSKQELEDRLVAASDELLQGEQLQSELTRMRVEHAEELIRLKERLDVAASDARSTKQSRDRLQILHQGVVDELARAQEDYERRLTQATDHLLTRQGQLEDSLAHLESKLEEQSQKFQDSVQEVGRLERRLQEEVDNHTREQELRRVELHSASERYQLAESVQAQLQHEVATVQEQFEQAGVQLELLQEEKTALQIEITALEAEGHRSISLGRFLESQVKESEATITALEGALQRTRADLCRSEKSGKTAEVNLSLQSAQHKRETSDLCDEIAALRSRPNLETVVAELEERNNEMEDLLRMKCTEIEDNDDRALEMLKENKKLTTKVESLARKVQNLQTKLTAAKAAIPKATSEAVNTAPSSSSTPTPVSPIPSAGRPRANTFTSIPPVPPIPRQVPSTPISRVPTNRTASGPSSLPRPKTPERRAALPPVFKARTPERQTASMTMPDLLRSSAAVGKKRRAPDDFDESVPPQGFTVDSIPGDEENTTPRVRRVLNSIHSGFTPMRHHSARPTVPMTSPRRVVAAPARPPFIADVTNSPSTVSQIVIAQAKPSKRSWLGKIRGVSSQTTGRTAASRPVFDREGES